MATAFERAYEQTVKNMTIAQKYAEDRQAQLRASAASQASNSQPVRRTADSQGHQR